MADQCQVIEHPSDLRVGCYSPVDSNFEDWKKTVERFAIPYHNYYRNDPKFSDK